MIPPDQHPVDPAAQKDRLRLGVHARLPLQIGLHGCFETVGVDAGFVEDATGQTVLLQQGEQQVLALKLLMASGLGQLLGSDNGGPGFFRELFRRGLHREVIPNCANRMAIPWPPGAANRRLRWGPFATGR